MPHRFRKFITKSTLPAVTLALAVSYAVTAQVQAPSRIPVPSQAPVQIPAQIPVSQAPAQNPASRIQESQQITGLNLSEITHSGGSLKLNADGTWASFAPDSNEPRFTYTQIGRDLNSVTLQQTGVRGTRYLRILLQTGEIQTSSNAQTGYRTVTRIEQATGIQNTPQIQRLSVPPVQTVISGVQQPVFWQQPRVGQIPVYQPPVYGSGYQSGIYQPGFYQTGLYQGALPAQPSLQINLQQQRALELARQQAPSGQCVSPDFRFFTARTTFMPGCAGGEGYRVGTDCVCVASVKAACAGGIFLEAPDRGGAQCGPASGQ